MVDKALIIIMIILFLLGYSMGQLIQARRQAVVCWGNEGIIDCSRLFNFSMEDLG